VRVTTPIKTASQRGRANRRRGHDAERALARYLRTSGWPHAERAVRAGFQAADRTVADPGDITGTPGLLWSVKNCIDERTDRWLNELDDMTDNAQQRGSRSFLIVRRPGHADPSRWWCWLWQGQYLDLYRTWLEQVDEVRQIPELPLWQPAGTEYPLRMELGHVVPLLRAVGYGEPLSDEPEEAS
jgi:Holliday junction resolvase